jgi:hypothetical protein
VLGLGKGVGVVWEVEEEGLETATAFLRRLVEATVEKSYVLESVV